MDRPKSLKQWAGRAVQSPTRRSRRRVTMPARQLIRPTSPTGALASDSSRLRTASPIGRLAQSATSDSDPASPTGGHRNPAHRSSPTGAARTDWAIRLGTPARKEPGANEESNPGRVSQTTIPGTIPCTPAGTVLCNHPDTNNIVGADISLCSIVGDAKTPIR